jgi:hypothetical protein
MKKNILSLSILFLILEGCSKNEDSNIINENISINNKWMLNKSIYQNVSQNLSNCEKQGYIHFFTNNTFERKNYEFIGNNCVLEGVDTGTYNYNSLDEKITLQFIDINDGPQIENLVNVNLTNLKLTFDWDEDLNGINEYNLEFIKE